MITTVSNGRSQEKLGVGIWRVQGGQVSGGMRCTNAVQCKRRGGIVEGLRINRLSTSRLQTNDVPEFR